MRRIELAPANKAIGTVEGMAMDSKAIVQASKKLSWLLRHGAREAGVTLDADGFASVGDVLVALRMPRALFELAVAQNDKKRFELDGDRVRACQGHSSGAVSTEAMEASWERLTECASLLWHGTTVEAARDGIARSGIVSASRTHVHLAAATDAKVGKRASVDVLLGVSFEAMTAAGEPVWKSPNGVLLARYVPVAAIVTVEAATRRGREELTRVRRAFGLAE